MTPRLVPRRRFPRPSLRTVSVATAGAAVTAAAVYFAGPGALTRVLANYASPMAVVVAGDEVIIEVDDCYWYARITTTAPARVQGPNGRPIWIFRADPRSRWAQGSAGVPAAPGCSPEWLSTLP